MSAEQKELTNDLLLQWTNAAAQLAKFRSLEGELRKLIFDLAFDDPKEGTNNHALGNDYVLKGVHKINRNPDIGALNAIKDELKENRMSADELIDYKPSLNKTAYKLLTEEQRIIFDQCLTIKPGMPDLSIVLPARKKTKE